MPSTKRTYVQVLKEVEDYDKILQANHSGFDNTYVMVALDDGSFFGWDSAFAVYVDNEEWLAVFTEHHGYHFFAAMDVARYRVFKDKGRDAIHCPWQPT